MLFDIETTAIASIVLYPELISDCGFDIHVDEFQNRQNQLIYLAVLKILGENQRPTPNMIWSTLKKEMNHTQVDELYLSMLPKYAEPSVQVLHDFKEEAITQKVESFAYEIIAQAKSGHRGFQALDAAISKLNSFQKSVAKKNNSMNLHDAVLSVLKATENPEQTEDYIYTPFPSLNNKIGSFMAGDILSIGARPGMGKTHLIVQQCEFTARSGIGTGIISTEMNSRSLAKRFIETELAVPTLAFRGNRITEEQINLIKSNVNVFSRLVDLAFVPSTTEEEVLAHIRRMIAEGKKLIVIDYLQSINFGEGRNFNLDASIGNFYKKLKGMALQHDMVFIVISQLNREVEEDKFKMPVLMKYFKGSGFIESHSDMIWTLWRPEYYDIYQDKDGNSLAGITRIFSLKGRDGITFKHQDLYWMGHKLSDKKKQEIEYEHTDTEF
jgi:replicative DNA helicase